MNENTKVNLFYPPKGFRTRVLQIISWPPIQEDLGHICLSKYFLEKCNFLEEVLLTHTFYTSSVLLNYFAKRFKKPF